MPKRNTCPCGKEKWDTSNVCLACSRAMRQVSHLTHRQCKICKEVKESSLMKKNNNGSPSRVCLKCGNLSRNTQTLEYKERNILNSLKRRLKSYGVLDIDAYMEFYNGKTTCELCNSVFTTTNYKCIDHCHNTGNYRGLICNDCNLGLGRFKDDINNLRLAIDYLENFNKREHL